MCLIFVFNFIFKVDGCVVADGACAQKCIPEVEDAIYQCESDYENGLTNDLEFYVCINKASLEFSNCFDVCACDSAWCNCNPPSAMTSPYDVVCYPQ